MAGGRFLPRSKLNFMITVQQLTKKYARNTAVDHISFEVGKGQIVGFLGPNGAGKTTTMRVLTCFLPPTSGSATVAGLDVLEKPLEVKRQSAICRRRRRCIPKCAPLSIWRLWGRSRACAVPNSPNASTMSSAVAPSRT